MCFIMLHLRHVVKWRQGQLESQQSQMSCNSQQRPGTGGCCIPHISLSVDALSECGSLLRNLFLLLHGIDFHRGFWLFDLWLSWWTSCIMHWGGLLGSTLPDLFDLHFCSKVIIAQLSGRVWWGSFSSGGCLYFSTWHQKIAILKWCH